MSTLSLCVFHPDSVPKPDLPKPKLLPLAFALLTSGVVTPRCFAPRVPQPEAHGGGSVPESLGYKRKARLARAYVCWKLRARASLLLSAWLPTGLLSQSQRDLSREAGRVASRVWTRSLSPARCFNPPAVLSALSSLCFLLVPSPQLSQEPQKRSATRQDLKLFVASPLFLLGSWENCCL